MKMSLRSGDFLKGMKEADVMYQLSPKTVQLLCSTAEYFL